MESHDTATALVVNADDFGLTPGANLGVIEAYREGIVTSASLATTADFYRQAVELVQNNARGLGVGLHFTLSAGRAVSDAGSVPLLTGRTGHLRWRFLSLLRAVRGRHRAPLLRQIELELDAQIGRLVDDGLAPDHINSERHIHQIPGVFECVVAAARRWGIPFVRLGDDVGRRYLRADNAAPLLAGAPLAKYLLLSTLTRRNRRLMAEVASCRYFASYLFSGRTQAFLPRLLASPPEGGVTEIMVHPGLPEHSRDVDLGNPGLEAYLRSEARRRELEACVRARQLAGRVNLTSFRELADGSDGDADRAARR